jgi:hypothetical protein
VPLTPSPTTLFCMGYWFLLTWRKEGCKEQLLASVLMGEGKNPMAWALKLNCRYICSGWSPFTSTYTVASYSSSFGKNFSLYIATGKSILMWIACFWWIIQKQTHLRELLYS